MEQEREEKTERGECEKREKKEREKGRGKGEKRRKGNKGKKKRGLGAGGVRKCAGRTTAPMVPGAALDRKFPSPPDAVTIATGERAAMGQDYYAVLELGRGATDADIKKA